MTTLSTLPAAMGASDQDLVAGTEVGEYRIEGVLGKGGFGTVYGAVQPLIGKRVAIKVLARKYSADPAIVSRFVAEARAVNQIRHRNIIDIFSFGQLGDGRHYYVMEHLDGQPLDGYIRDHGAMPLHEALPILRAIARALDAAHAKGIAHRDLKPENIFLAEETDGGVFPKLLDFGIAKLLAPEDDVMHRTGTGVPIGTPYFMSPEQCRGREVDHRTDHYSFGIVAYRLLTGAFPFEGGDYMELLFKQVNEEPPAPTSINPSLPPSVDEAIAWMMRKDREQRPSTIVEGVNALDPTASFNPTPVPPSNRASHSSTGRGARNAVELAETGISSPNALASTTPSLTPSSFTPPSLPAVSAQVAARPAQYRGLLVGVFVVATIAGIGVYLATRTQPAPPASAQQRPPDPTPPPPATGSAVPAVVPAATLVDAAVQPERVQVTLTGVPTGATVLRDGKPLGVAPKFSLPHGTETVDLVLEHDGYQVLAFSITPDRTQTLPLVMKRKPRGKAKDDLASPFGPAGN